jgi:acyl-CoA reductase-like NAD-dependent aldehyde dehydrogenase
MSTAVKAIDEQPARGTRMVESRDPATGEVWRRWPAATPDEVHAAVERARAAQRDWAARPAGDRAQVIDRFHALLHSRRTEMATTIMRENGKPISEALGTEVMIVLDQARFVAREAPRVQAPGRWRRPEGLPMWRKRMRVEHHAFGTVAVISPWNYPLMLAAGIIMPALATGNAVVHKPSEFTPGTALLLAELLHEAGVPQGVLETIIGDATAGAALTASAVAKVFFIGSVGTGRKVAAACATRLVPCVLELGGSDPAIVLDDADVRTAASGIAWGRFSNAGQTCVAPKRVFVTAPAYDAFLQALETAVRALRVGPGSAPETDVPPLVRPSQLETLQAQLDDALRRGARIAAQAVIPPGLLAGAYFPPTVLVEVPEDARVLREETFGPLLPVVRVRDEHDAVARANASPFGLSASVWSRDAARALRVAGRLEAGSVTINDVLITAGMADVAHGGVKESGTGRSHGLAGLMECVQSRTIVADRFGSWRQPWWFGYGSEHAADYDAFARLAHSRSAGERLSGLARTLRLMFRPQRPL